VARFIGETLGVGASVSELRLTVLGSGVAWANPGGACSGYLVSAGDTNLLIECGSGTFGRLRAVHDPSRLDAIIISHLHADHMLDLVPFRYGVKYGGLSPGRRPCLLVPPGGADFLEGLGQALDGRRFFADVFDVAEYRPSATLRFGDATVQLRPVQHYVPSYSMRITAGRTLTYSADAAPCQALIEHARDSDVLLCESALRHLGEDQPDPAKRGHHTPTEAGATATRAGVRRLLLTHSPLDPSDPGWAAREAHTTFAGPVERVVDGETYWI
jgi:ribonuclease BN (tRNA processing enzyme)